MFTKKHDNASRRVFEAVLFAMLGALMLVGDIAMEALPNIHLVGVLTVVYTVVFRARALIPLYVYVFLNGAFSGFALWWLPYLYIWLPLWGAAMLIPRRAPRWLRCVLYPTVTALHGLLFGVLYAPAQALVYGFDFEATLAWIASGLVFDLVHTLGNFALGLLAYPLSEALRRLLARSRYYGA